MKSSHLKLYKDITLLFLKHGRSAQREKDSVAAHYDIDDEVSASDSAEEFTADLEKLGPTFVKVGQLLSTRPDLLPPSWLLALQRLQDDVAEVPFEEVRESIEAEFGFKLSKLFIEFDEEPLASASLGQVHRARLRGSEREVAVKVQRPGAREKVIDELEALAEVADFLEKHTDFGARYEPGRVVEQFQESILRELNYHEEARNLDRLRENLVKFPNLIVPKPYHDFCTRKVLTMDLIKGQRVTDLSGVVHTDLDGTALANELFTSYLKQVLEDGFFHADPHPGNLLLTEDRKIALLDLGMVGSVSEGMRTRLLQLLTAIADGRSEQAAALTRQIGTPKDDFDQVACDREITAIVESRQSSSVGEMELGKLIVEVTEACGTYGLRIPNSVFMLGKMLLNLDLIAKELDPEFNPNQAIRTEASALAKQRLVHDLTTGNILHLVTDLKEAVSQTPSRINEFLSNLSTNKFRVEVDAIDEKRLLNGFQKVANRITAGLILSALIIGAAMMMNIESETTLFGYPALAIVFFMVAAVGGIFMVGKILWSDR